ncbi:prepilin-type N-terminal cleavage/methylation domain-containing protein [bacterium]|nr:prepilin-type N-terminal cleavage/methylation domain-containing protein [bacterium]
MRKYAVRSRAFSLIEVVIGIAIMAVFIAPVLVFFTNIKSSEIDVQKMSEVTFLSVSVFELLKSVPFEEVVVGEFTVDYNYIRAYLVKIPDKDTVPSFQDLIEYLLHISETRKINGKIIIEEIDDEYGLVKVARMNLSFIPTQLRTSGKSRADKERIFTFQYILSPTPGIL